MGTRHLDPPDKPAVRANAATGSSVAAHVVLQMSQSRVPASEGSVGADALPSEPLSDTRFPVPRPLSVSFRCGGPVTSSAEQPARLPSTGF